MLLICDLPTLPHRSFFCLNFFKGRLAGVLSESNWETKEEDSLLPTFQEHPEDTQQLVPVLKSESNTAL